MPVTIGDQRLWGAQESTTTSEARLNVTSVQTKDSDETIITGFRSAEQNPLSGTVTGPRLARNGDYPSDKRDAIAQYINELESFVSPTQGVGYTLSDDERDRDTTVIVQTATWTISYGAPYEARWTLDVARGEGVLSSSPRSVADTTPNSSETIDSTDMGTIDEKRTELSIDVDVSPIAYADASETIIVPNSGVTRRVTISARKGGTLSSLRSFDDTMRGYVGNKSTRTFQTAMPGTSHEVLIESYDGTIRAGVPNILDYRCTLFEGLNYS